MLYDLISMWNLKKSNNTKNKLLEKQIGLVAT